MRNYLTTISLFLMSATLMAQAPEKSEDIMLQGFYWESQRETGWSQLAEQVEDISRNFTAIWLPPSSAPEGGGVVGGNNVGYHPRIWNDQNSCWGTADNLKSLINQLHNKNVKVIADIVINHRAGYTSWATFAPDDFGEYGKFQLTAEHVCNDDEVNTNASAGAERGTATGKADTGDKWEGARDLDHTSEYVQNDIKAYLNWLKGEIGYDGWRYDLVKGYGAEYVGVYNDASAPYISVGEYWDGGYDAVWNWIQGTGKKSMAFDFPAKYAIFNDGLAKNDFSKMTWGEDFVTPRPAGLIHHAQSRRYAVTFIDNHDTYRDANKYTGDVLQAYAVLLSAPGIPCVFWPHWTSQKDGINKQIAARRAAGINSESQVLVTQSGNYYECIAEGTRGSLICRVGANAPANAPEGYHLDCSVKGKWYYFLSDNVHTAVSHIEASTNVALHGNVLSINALSKVDIDVSLIDGKTIVHGTMSEANISLPRGVNIVRIADKVYKFLVK